MKKGLLWIIIFCIVLTVSLTGCAQEKAQPTASPEPTATIQPQNTAKPGPTVERLAFKKLNELTSYYLVITVTNRGGATKGWKNKFEAVHFPSVPAYDVLHYAMAANEKQFKLEEQQIMIEKKEWTKKVDKEWRERVSALSSMITSYTSEFTSLYLSLRIGEFELVGDETVAGVQTKRYKIEYKTSKTRVWGDVWLANQKDLPPVPVKWIGEQTAFDDKGKVIDDKRNLAFEFEVSKINAAPTVKPPK